jgi:phosphohistidine phosphatase
MLDLYLLRHAKSDWPSEGGPDRDRVLAPRGIRDAGAMGDYMSRSGFLLDTVLCSGAARTRQTLNLITQKWRQEIDIRYSDTLYSGGVQAYLNLARELPETCASAMLLAHNPTIHQLALALTGGGPPDDHQRLSRKYPTSGLAVIRFATDRWSDIGQGGGNLLEFVTPKTINQGKEDI